MATLDELIGPWTLSLRAANRAPRTVAQYVDESLAQFRRWLAEQEPDLASASLTRQHVGSYTAKEVWWSRARARRAAAWVRMTIYAWGSQARAA